RNTGALKQLRLRHVLFDAAEHGVAPGVAHFDFDPVAPLQERRHRLAVLDRLDHALLGDAGIAAAALADWLAGPAIGAAVRHRSRANDRAGAEIAGLGCVGD